MGMPFAAPTGPTISNNNSKLEPEDYLYCKKCALLKPAVEFASTTGFFNNNCKHCRNYRRKGEDSKSEKVQEIFKVTSLDELKFLLARKIEERSEKLCVHFYLDVNFSIGNFGESFDIPDQVTIDHPKFKTPEGRSQVANYLIQQVKSIDHYSYNHRSTRLFKSGETHKYLCSQSIALPWRQKKLKSGNLNYSSPNSATPGSCGLGHDLYDCGGTILIKFQSPGDANQRVCVAYCHDTSHPPKMK